MIRARFYCDDSRPVKWPPPYPFWCTGETDNHEIVVGYYDNEDQIYEYYPEAFNIISNEVDEIRFSDRFERPDWWEET